MIKVLTIGFALAAMWVWFQVFCGLGQAGAKACRKTIEWGQKDD